MDEDQYHLVLYVVKDHCNTHRTTDGIHYLHHREVKSIGGQQDYLVPVLKVYKLKEGKVR
jgi:hypothetical protein